LPRSSLSACDYADTVRLLQRVRPPRIGAAAPDFTVHDSDRTVTLSQLKGQVVVLNFWATWCPPCVEEVPSLVQMQQRMKAKGVTVLAVSVDVDETTTGGS
jgi:cytochrome c biogenesis protein CcmG/thiol:disulfide interchange protein DsbE